MADLARVIAIETEQARAVLAAVAESIGDDDQAAVDAIEGETNLLEAIDRGLARVREMEAFVIGLEAHIEGIRRRIERLKRGDTRIREAMRMALLSTTRPKIERALGTISLRAKPRAVVELDVALVPADYMVPQPAKLDKLRARKDMLGGVKVPGLTLSEPAQILHIG